MGTMLRHIVKRSIVHTKMILLVISFLLIIGIVWLCISAFHIRGTNLAELHEQFSDWNIDNNERVLIVAPHCDDEILGCGGLIGSLVAKGVRVKVVLATNGDGFYYAAARDLRDIIVQPSNFVDFGYERQQESLNALKILGVPYDSVIFLGYPDRGLEEMWSYNWRISRPYQSPYTKDSKSPYRNSYSRKTPYSGRALLSDLKSIITDFKPTSIYYPHPSDQHTDHWAVNCFVTQALYDLNLLSKVRTGLYIVHRGDWPTPQGLNPSLPMAPPASLTDSGTTWYEYPLDDDIVAKKIDATRMYKTQLPVLRRFLMSFARSSEVFGTYGPAVVQKIDHLDWDNIEPCILDPSGDGLNVDIGRSGDITMIKCCYDDDYLYVEVHFAHKCSRRLTYGIRIHGLPDTSGRFVNIRINRGRTKGPAQTSMRGNSIKIKVPLYKLGDWSALMINADSSLSQYQVDRAAWRLLEKENPESSAVTNLQFQGLSHREK